MNKIILIIVLSIFLTSCSNSLERLKKVGKKPQFENVAIPTVTEDEEDMRLREKRLNEQYMHVRKTNSLWKPGATKFFRDSRAWRIGDIIRVVVEIKDNAILNNSTRQNRSGKDSLGVPHLFGLEKDIKKALNTTDTNSLLGVNSSRNHLGSGNISRREDIKTEVAATVHKILPNGNLIIQGHQEVRVNYELREVKIAGIIRPKDITSTNTINSNQMAEARISYGGRGIMSDVQNPRYGSQILDIIAPF